LEQEGHFTLPRGSKLFSTEKQRVIAARINLSKGRLERGEKTVEGVLR